MGNRLHSYRRLLQYARPYRSTVVIAVGASAIAALATSFYAWLVGPLLKAVLTRSDLQLPFVKVEGARLLWVLPAAVVVVAVVKASAQFLQNGLMTRTGQRVMADLRRDLYSKLLGLP
ncbi:MAG: ABC transporter ATP-binding protein, partial [Myxococcaceae bacterium]